jgi:hypothetical protein
VQEPRKFENTKKFAKSVQGSNIAMKGTDGSLAASPARSTLKAPRSPPRRPSILASSPALILDILKETETRTEQTDSEDSSLEEEEQDEEEQDEGAQDDSTSLMKPEAQAKLRVGPWHLIAPLRRLASTQR